MKKWVFIILACYFPVATVGIFRESKARYTAESEVRELEKKLGEGEGQKKRVEKWKKLALDCKMKVTGLEGEIEKRKAEARRWREQSFSCLSEYSKATGQKGNSGILRAVMNAMEIKDNGR